MKAVESQMVTEEGAWNSMQWGSITEETDPYIQEKPANGQTPGNDPGAQRDGTSLQKLEAQQPESGHTNHPWLLQVTMRSNRFWELLQQLAHSRVRQLIHARLRPHQSKTNPLAETLAKSLREKS